jgi:hypothetical protein
MDDLLDLFIDEMDEVSDHYENSIPTVNLNKRQRETSQSNILPKGVDSDCNSNIKLEDIRLDALVSVLDDIKRDMNSHRRSFYKVYKKVEEDAVRVQEIKTIMKKYVEDANFMISFEKTVFKRT